MRKLAAFALLALAACSRTTPRIEDDEAAALREVAALDQLVVFDDLYDFAWRGAEEHALAHSLPAEAEKARKARDDMRDAVVITDGHVMALRVGGSKMKSLAPLAKLTRLVVLDLHDGEIADTTGLASLKDLDHLALNGNKLTTTTLDLPRLRSVYLADNPIEAFQGFHDVPMLEVVNLSGTRIAKMEGLGAVPKLKTLSLQRTRVSRIENLREVPDLEDLDLSSCPIETIDDLGAAPHLKFLDLWHDRIRFVAGLDEMSKSVVYIGLGENPYDWGDANNQRVMAKVSAGRIITWL